MLVICAQVEAACCMVACCCRCNKAVELFAAACVRLGIPQHSQVIDPYSGQRVPADPRGNPYSPAVPEPLRQHLAGMLPGVYAMSCTPFPSAGLPDPEFTMQLLSISRITQAALKVCHPQTLPCLFVMSFMPCYAALCRAVLCCTALRRAVP